MKKRDNSRIEKHRKYKQRKIKRLFYRPKRKYIPPIDESSSPVLDLGAPINFSFINNTDELLKLFDDGTQYIARKRRLNFDLKNIGSLTSDAIAVFCSKLTDPKYSKGVQLSGNAPKTPELKEMFLGSGFYDHVISSKKPQRVETNYLLHKVSNKKTDTAIAKTATDFAAKHTFKDQRKFRQVYEVLIELMSNTNNHASPICDGFYDWWLYVFYDKQTNVTSYSFLDFGIGIFRSKPFTKYRDFILFTYKKPKSTFEMANDLLEGRITSRTGLDERGRGFTCITRNAAHQSFQKFIIISNNVYIDVKNKCSHELNREFNGTFVYWEICNANQNIK